jgi:iron(III) transport system ATP-binding protein
VPSLSVSGLTKRFGDTPVLDEVTFTVANGELFTLVGPSGCGKTTTLLSIAGFVAPDHGVIRCGGDTFVDPGHKVNVPAERRNLGIVFQSYAVWPHMTVEANVAFPLKIRRMPSRARRQQVADVLELVELGGLARRYPHQLSGGQRQRVALARALVYRPSVLLLDEPFSNLDAKLRERARVWLRDLQQRLGITTIFVTHDQEEALSLSDRVLVMSGGHVLRVGTPEEVYREPGNRFVAEFIGQCNFIEGSLDADDTGVWLSSEVIPSRIRVNATGRIAGSRATVAIRPEEIEMRRARDAEPDWIPGEIVNSTYLGNHRLYTVHVNGTALTVRTNERFPERDVRVRVRDGAASVVSETSTEAVPAAADGTLA